MLSKNTTIEFKDKKYEACSNRINNLLKDMPSYCRDYDKYLASKNTIKTRMEYLQDINIFFKFIKQKNPSIVSLKDISPEVLESINGFDFDEYTIWLSGYKFDYEDCRELEKENTAVTKRRKLTAVRSLYHFLFIRDIISSNPAEKIIMPPAKRKKRKDIRILEDNELPLFLEKIEDGCSMAGDNIKKAIAVRDRAIIYLFLGTGLRVSELCAINCSDISFDLGTINVIRKEDRDEDRTTDRVYMSDTVRRYIGEYIDSARNTLAPDGNNHDALFISSKHARITPRAVEMMVKGYADKALGKNSGITPHKLRATFGTKYYGMTGDISATSTVMNHASIEITAAYYIREDKMAKEKVKEMKY